MSPASETEPAYALAFETSSAMGDVALGLGDRVLATRRLSAPRRHAVEFLPTVAALCAEQGVSVWDVGFVFVSAGPGSFTGLRIGMTAARSVTLATGAPVVKVPTLDVIAQNALDAADVPDRVAVLLDAKRKRVYASTFVRENGVYRAEAEPIEVEPAAFLADRLSAGSGGAVLGEGVEYHQEAVASSGWRVLPSGLSPPRAETVYRLGREMAARGAFTDRSAMVPTYVRLPEAEEKWNQANKS